MTISKEDNAKLNAMAVRIQSRLHEIGDDIGFMLGAHTKAMLLLESRFTGQTLDQVIASYEQVFEINIAAMRLLATADDSDPHEAVARLRTN